MNMTKLHLPVLGSALVTLALFSAPAWSYDVDLAARYAQMFAPAKEKATGKELHCLKPEGFMNMIKKGEPLVGLDIRTPVEVSVFNLALPGSLSIPIDELFLPENLARIPKDRPVVVLCKSGIRAGMAVVALRQLDFDKVFALQGGFKALSDYLDPVTAYSPVPAPPPGK
jgi:rhodanese-related sulfurtransferase